MANDAARTLQFSHFGMIVTGQGERSFMPTLFRSLMATGLCTFEVISRIGQRSPRTSPKYTLRVTGTNKAIPNRDADDIGIPARRYLSQGGRFVILVDDLEHSRANNAIAIFRRYRDALDTMLIRDEWRRCAAVHFMVNMLEAYFLADAAAVNSVLGTTLADCTGDAEGITHPKRQIMGLGRGYNEVEDGKAIAAKLDLEHVLSRPDTCASLRTLFAWCWEALGNAPGEKFLLSRGIYSTLTGSQIKCLTGSSSTLPL